MWNHSETANALGGRGNHRKLAHELTSVVMFLPVLLLVLLCGTSVRAGEPRPEIWPGLDTGPYAVGYMVWHRHDILRSFPPVWRAGVSADQVDSPRPVQISIWYPATTPDEVQYLTLQDYLFSAATAIDFTTPDELGKLRHVREVQEIARAEGISEERLAQAMARTTAAIRDAPLATGPFPVLLFVPGTGGPSFQAAALFEYLASHGYIVAACPSVGPHTRDMPSSQEGLAASVGDLRFMRAQLLPFPSADQKRVGLIGYSFGALSTVIFAMQEPEAVHAVLALDPGYRVAKNQRLLKEAKPYDPQHFVQPLMLLLARGVGGEPDRRLAADVAAAEVTLLHFVHLRHGDFVSLPTELLQFTRDEPGRDFAKVREGHAVACRYARAFFDAHLLRDLEASEFLDRSPEENGVPDGTLTVEPKAETVKIRAAARRVRFLVGFLGLVALGFAIWAFRRWRHRSRAQYLEFVTEEASDEVPGEES